MIRRLIVLTVAATALSVGHAAAQSAFPAPLPNQGQAGTASDPAFPPVNGARASRAGTASDPAFPPVNGAPAARVGATPSAFPANGGAPIAGGGLSSPPPPPGAGGGAAGDACMKEAIPYGGLPIGQAAALAAWVPLVYPRREAKDYGTKKLIEGKYEAGETVVVVEDLVTTGGSKLEVIAPLSDAGPLSELSRRTLGDALATGSPFLRRHYLMGQFQVREIGNVLDVLLRYVHGVEERAGRISSILEWRVSERVQLFGVAAVGVDRGGESEFTSILATSLSLGAEIHF